MKTVNLTGCFFVPALRADRRPPRKIASPASELKLCEGKYGYTYIITRFLHARVCCVQSRYVHMQATARRVATGSTLRGLL
jgi:hypothetical protein